MSDNIGKVFNLGTGGGQGGLPTNDIYRRAEVLLKPGPLLF